MFTGIVTDIGTVTAIEKHGDWVLTVETKILPTDKLDLGASIACNGICLTVIEKKPKEFKVQLSMETLSKTTAIHWRVGTRVNLEPSLKMGDELGGHLTSGHVDGLARVIYKKTVGESLNFVFEVPNEFSKFIAAKGSIAIDGISLTVNSVDGAKFQVNIIPYTQQLTTITALDIGSEANFEIDMIARYIERMQNLKA